MRRASLFAGIALMANAALAQQLGPVESFGDEGRLYSTDRYLISRQSYGTEDSTGYEGQFRVVKRYEGGGYEIEIFDYVARCRAVDDNSMLMTFRQGDRNEALASVQINIQKRPGKDLTNAYNLYWAACAKEFHKFR